jgi:putative ABC transport system permease protein
MVVKRPGVTVTAALCLAIGIGATTVIFSLVNGILLRSLPYEEPDRLVAMWAQFENRGVDQSPSSGNDLTDYRKRARAFEGIEAMIPWYFNLTSGAEPERKVGGMISAGLFPLLGVDPALGRHFTAEEGAAKAPVVLISHRLWQNRYGGDREVIGRVISIEEKPYEVVGVMPADFSFLIETADLWTPWTPTLTLPRRLRNALVVGRLKDGVSVDDAQQDMNAVAAAMQQDYPDAYPEGSGWGVLVRPLHQEVVGNIRPQLLTLFGAVGLVLLIACVNVANLLLAQATRREREIALRTALGARRSDVVRQLLTESVILGVLGGGLGLLLAVWGVRAVTRLELRWIPRLDSVGIDWTILLFALGVSVLTGVLFGLVPALKASKPDVYEALREGTKASEAGGKHLLRRALVVAEVAIGVVVLMAAGLMVRSFRAVDSVDPGFDTEGTVTIELALLRTKYLRSDQQRGFYQRLMPELRSRPEFEQVGLVTYLPLAPLDHRVTLEVEGREVAEGAPNPEVSLRMISPGYFQTMEIPLLLGEDFTDLDTGESRPVVIVDKGVAERLWPGEDPIGRRIRLTPDRVDDWRTVVGVVAGIKDRDLVGENDELIYVPFLQHPWALIAVAAETSLDEEAGGAVLREVLRQVDPVQPVKPPRSTAQLMADAKSGSRFNRMLFGFFGLATLVLVAVGIYGVMSYSVVQRSREIGLRMALGAHRGSVIGLVVRQGIGLALLGLVVGGGLVFLLAQPAGRYVEHMLIGVETTDLVTLGAVALLLLALTLLASFVPAYRASRIDPMQTLREE